MYPFKRFDAQNSNDTIILAVKIPFTIRSRVAEVFYPYLSYRKGITMHDAYLHCVAKAVSLYSYEEHAFFAAVAKSGILKTAERNINNIYLTPSVNEDIVKIMEVINANKQITFLYLVSVGVELWATEFENEK